MATSGTATFNMYRREIIDAALRKVGVDMPTDKQASAAATALNMIVKDWSENYGIQFWKIEWKTKTFTAASEVTGTDGNIYTCIRSHTSAASNKPVTGADWTAYWIVRGTTGGTWLTATAYASTGDFTPDTDVIAIDTAFWRNNGNNTPLSIIDRYDYFDDTNKTSESIPCALWLDRTSVAPVVRLDYNLSDLDYVLHYLQVVRMEDMTFDSDTPDIPARRLRALVYALAVDLSYEHDVEPNKRSSMKNMVNELLKANKKGDSERTSSEFIHSTYHTRRRIR